MRASDPLLRLLKHDWDPSSWTDFGPEPDIDWTEVVRAALRHGVAGLMCRSIAALPRGIAPQEIVDAAVTHLEAAHEQGAALVAQMMAVLDVLAADGIAALPFKGPALATLAHASATIRPSRDIDVLVRKHDMARAMTALGRLGYRGEVLPPKVLAACYESYGQDIVFADGRAPVEPHWAFVPSTLAVDLDMDGIWRRASPLVVAERTVQTLSLEDTVLAACVHGSKERWWRLLWVADVAALIHRHRALDWIALVDRARACGARRMLLLGVALARDLFGCAVPETVASSIDRDETVLRFVKQIERDLSDAETDPGPPERVSRYYWEMRERPGDRVRCVWRTLTTPRFQHYRMIRLPDALFRGYVVVKVVHDYVLLPLWWLGKGRWLRRPAS